MAIDNYTNVIVENIGVGKYRHLDDVIYGYWGKKYPIGSDIKTFRLGPEFSPDDFEEKQLFLLTIIEMYFEGNLHAIKKYAITLARFERIK